jgi:hypothetical protein
VVMRGITLAPKHGVEVSVQSVLREVEAGRSPALAGA